MSNRVSYSLAVALLLLGAVLRFTNLATLPAGFSGSEINNIRIAETVRQGRVEVFYNLRGEGREGLYQAAVTAVTTPGSGIIGYRILSVWLGLLTLALVYVLGTRLFGSLAGLASMALMTVTMAPIVLSRQMSPEALLPLFVTAVLAALTLSLPIPGAQPIRGSRTAAFAALGVMLGLGLYAHPISLVVTLFSMVFIASIILVRRPLTRRTISFTWFALVIMIVIAMPYVISSLQHPELAAARRLLVEDPSKSFVQSFIDGFTGLFLIGDSNPAVNLPSRPLIDLVSGLIMIVGGVAAVRGWRESRCSLLLTALVFIAPFSLHAPNSPNFEAYAPLLPLVALFFGLGATTLYHSLPNNSRRIAALGLVALFAFNIVWLARDLFTHWANLPEMQQVYNTRLGQIAHFIDTTADTTPTVICTSTLKPQINPVTLTDTQLIALMMHRQNAVLRYADCGSALILTEGGEHEQVILLEPSGFAGVNPYLQNWLELGSVLDRPDVPAGTVIDLRVADALATRIGGFMTTAPIMFDPQATETAEVVPPPVRFGGNVTFLGYEHSWANVYRPGDVVPVVTYWRVDGVVPPDLRLFTHILSDPTNIVAQNDPSSVVASQLLPRDIFIQVTYVQLPRRILEGTYSLSVGAYPESTGIRLPVFQGDQPRGARLFVGQITVQDS
ncbi:MAG: phospholipid carrier-dependent glycosyltransferase [Anaerolineae bacterium]|nr:phospholipid carrier-dependent glycosyltransferase [Anaerolineae bacterium]